MIPPVTPQITEGTPSPHCPPPWASPGTAPAAPRAPRVVAFGGGHGLAASLSALRRVTDDVTAIVTVADNGGSSGRLRREFGALPPGDLRMALAALCGDDDWGTTWARVVQHRFGGEGDLAGDSLGNLTIGLLIMALVPLMFGLVDPSTVILTLPWTIPAFPVLLIVVILQFREGDVVGATANGVLGAVLMGQNFVRGLLAGSVKG